MRDPVPFLRARIDEDNAATTSAVAFLRTLPPKEDRIYREPGLVYITVDDDGNPQPDRFVPMVDEELESFTIRYDPNRARYDAQAREAIAEEHRETEGHVCHTCVTIVDDKPAPVTYPCITLRLVTWAYGDHPDYDGDWDA